MKSVRKLAVLFLAFCIGTAGAGCSREETEEKTEYSLYYLSLAESSLETEGYEPTERTTEAMVEEVCRLTQEEEDSEIHLRLLPQGVEILDCTYKGQTVTLNFNEGYKKMNNTREILVRAGLVKSFTQIPGVTYVSFLDQGESMTDSDGNQIGLMDKDTFVENEGKNINSYTSSSINLYFANKKGDHLVKETISKYYSSNVPLERVVLESLIKGPEDAGLQATISPNTKILGVSIVDGICYVNLDKTFMTEAMSVQEELPVYSIVNSLTDACGVHGVQISVEGETKVTFRESMNLDMMYKADYSLLNDDEEGSNAQTAASEKGEK